MAEQFAVRLGWTIDEAVNLGFPESMFVHRGAVPEEDNIVFYYPDHVYLFWFRDRVWQVRVDERWQGEVDGVSMGMSRHKVESLWGKPINTTEISPTWTLPDKGYPCRIRLFFRNKRLVDMYIFRSDW